MSNGKLPKSEEEVNKSNAKSLVTYGYITEAALKSIVSGKIVYMYDNDDLANYPEGKYPYFRAYVSN